ncbi:MAG: N-acetylmuramoyl-L-alanine amidase family protein [Archangium sp.]
MPVLLALLLSAWPANDAALTPLPLPEQPTRKVRVFIDAGHGAPNNVGAFGCHCQEEHLHTLAAAQKLGSALLATGRFEVMQSRLTTSGAKYAVRLARAKEWKADVIISLHSDVRGEAWPLAQPDAGTCWQNPNAPGFAVLWNDEGPAFPNREKLGRAVGTRLREAGFLAYSGDDYGALYRQDDVEPSGWIDIRPMKKRVYFLRGSTIPTVIVETHHALDVQEVARWEEPATHAAFASAIGAAVLDFMRAAP